MGVENGVWSIYCGSMYGGDKVCVVNRFVGVSITYICV